MNLMFHLVSAAKAKENFAAAPPHSRPTDERVSLEIAIEDIHSRENIFASEIF